MSRGTDRHFQPHKKLRFKEKRRTMERLHVIILFHMKKLKPTCDQVLCDEDSKYILAKMNITLLGWGAANK